MSMNSFHARTARSKKPAVRPVVQHHGTRADAWLVQHGLAPSRTAAQRLIEAGRVSLDGETILKPAQLLPDDAVPVIAPPIAAP